MARPMDQDPDPEFPAENRSVLPGNHNVETQYMQFFQQLQQDYQQKFDTFQQETQERMSSSEAQWMKILKEKHNKEAVLEDEIDQLRKQLETTNTLQLPPTESSAPIPAPSPTTGAGITGLSPPAQHSPQPRPAKGAPLPNSVQQGQLNVVPASAEANDEPPIAARKLADHQLAASQIPKDAAKLKECLELHIRMLWGHLNSTSKPPTVSVSQLAEFNARFSHELSETELTAICASNQSLILPSLVQIQSAIPVTIDTSQSKILSGARRLEEFVLEYIQAAISKFGLKCWCPDMTQTAGSVYNSACRIIALDTFRQAVAGQQYRLDPAANKHLKNMPLLINIYNNFVHFRMCKTFRREMLHPGKTKQLAGNNPAYQNRTRLCRSRREFLKTNGYKRYLKYIDPKSTSNDEVDPAGTRINGRPVHFIKIRRERSAAVTTMIRLLDHECDQVAKFEGKTYRQERIRILPDNPEDSAFPLLPFNAVPLDYYDPTFFNSLQPGTRKKIAGDFPIVGLLPDASQSFGHGPNRRPHPDEKLMEKAFNEKYGSEVLGQYVLEDLDEIDFAGSEEDDDDDEYETEGGDMEEEL